MPQYTLLYLLDSKRRQILLAMKKRRFGEGKWNGVGGRAEEGETVEDAAVREAYEEIGVEIEPDTLLCCGIIRFSFKDRPALDRDVHVFFTEKWKGEPAETEEMRPHWFDIDMLPYDEMWVADTHWLPKMLDGEIIRAHIDLFGSGDAILHMKIEIV